MVRAAELARAAHTWISAISGPPTSKPEQRDLGETFRALSVLHVLPFAETPSPGPEPIPGDDVSTAD